MTMETAEGREMCFKLINTPEQPPPYPTTRKTPQPPHDIFQTQQHVLLPQDPRGRHLLLGRPARRPGGQADAPQHHPEPTGRSLASDATERSFSSRTPSSP